MGIATDGRIVIANGEFVLFLAGIGVAAVVVGAGEIAVEAKGRVAILQRQIEFPKVIACRTAVVQSQSKAQLARPAGLDDRRAGGDDDSGIRAVLTKPRITGFGQRRSDGQAAAGDC